MNITLLQLYKIKEALPLPEYAGQLRIFPVQCEIPICFPIEEKVRQQEVDRVYCVVDYIDSPKKGRRLCWIVQANIILD